MAKKASKDYFGMDWLISLILAIIPVTSLVLGFLTRLSEGKIVAAVLRLVLGWNLIWILDILCMITKHRIVRLLNI